MEAKEKMKVLMMMARADGKVDPASTMSKIAFLAQRARKWDIAQDEYGELFRTTMMGPVDVKLTLPTALDEQAEMLSDLVELMMLDGEAHEGEKQLLTQIATAFGISPARVASMIADHL